VFAIQVFDAGEVGFGILMAARGLGALVGPFFGHRAAGAGHRKIFAAIGIALAVFGGSYMGLGLAPTLWAAAIVIFVAHLGGGSQWVLSSYGLQRLVPDYIRGRVFAVDFAMITLSLAFSSLVAAALSDSAGPRIAAFILGGVAVTWAAVWWVLTRRVRRRPPFDD
jgi:MFS transporter